MEKTLHTRHFGIHSDKNEPFEFRTIPSSAEQFYRDYVESQKESSDPLAQLLAKEREKLGDLVEYNND